MADGDFSNEVPEGAKGLDRVRRKGDPVKRWLMARRPVGQDASRWTNYRTEACMAWNAAHEAGAPAEVMARLDAEYEAAVLELEKASPHIDWRGTLQPFSMANEQLEMFAP